MQFPSFSLKKNRHTYCFWRWKLDWTFTVRAPQRSYLLAWQTFTPFLMSTNQAFAYLISKRTWYTLDQRVLLWCGYLVQTPKRWSFSVCVFGAWWQPSFISFQRCLAGLGLNKGWTLFPSRCGHRIHVQVVTHSPKWSRISSFYTDFHRKSLLLYCVYNQLLRNWHRTSHPHPLVPSCLILYIWILAVFYTSKHASHHATAWMKGQ